MKSHSLNKGNNSISSTQRAPLLRRGTIALANADSSKKALVIRPESPKTREACLALGYDPSIFKLKTNEEFGGTEISEEVKQMRYEHYKKKTETAFYEIGMKRKEIIRKNRQLVNLHLERSYERDDGIANDLIDAYNKRMSEVNMPPDENSFLSFDENDPVLVLEGQLDKEVKKFHKSMAVKSKEVQFQIENEKKRLELGKELQMREKKIEELQAKLTQKKELTKKQRKLEAEKKYNERKERERQAMEQQMEDREKQLQKLETLRQKLRDEELKRKQDIEDHEKKEREKLELVKMRKLAQDEQFKSKLSQTMTSIQTKQQQQEQKYLEQLQNKTDSLSMRMTMNETKRQQFKLLTQQKEESIVSQLINKLVSKDGEIQTLQQQKMMEEQKKIQEERARRRKISQSLQLIKGQQNQRVKDIENKFKEMEKNDSRRKVEQEYEKFIKKERFLLKQQDLQENYKRQERLKDFKFKQLIKQNQSHNEQKSLEKLSNELVKKAQQELQRRLKLENTNLDASLLNVSQGDVGQTFHQINGILEKNIKNYSQMK